MIGFNLLQDLKKSNNLEQKEELIAKAIEQLEEGTKDFKSLATKEDLKDLELRIVSKMFQHTLFIVVSLGALSMLSKWLFHQ